MADLKSVQARMQSMRGKVTSALASKLDPDYFLQVASTYLVTHPDILAADELSLLGSIMKGAELGLPIDGEHAAVVVYKTKVKQGGREAWVSKAQFIPMYRGLVQLALALPGVDKLVGRIVYEADEFEVLYGDEERIHHRPSFGDRGPAVAFYAIAWLSSGGHRVFEVMSVQDVEAVRDGSKGAKNPVWKNKFKEMGRKTVTRALMKWLPMRPEITKVVAQDEAFDAGKAVLDVTPNRKEPNSSDPVDDLNRELSEDKPRELNEGQPPVDFEQDKEETREPEYVEAANGREQATPQQSYFD